MKHILILILCSISIQTSFSQIITVEVVDNFEYEHKPGHYDIALTEMLIRGESAVERHAERKEKFNSNLNIVYKYLEENQITFEEMDDERDPNTVLPAGAIPLNYVKLKVSSDKDEIKNLENFVAGIGGIRMNNEDLMISVDDAFMEYCMDSIVKSARAKATTFANGLKLELIDIHEIKILEHKVRKIKDGSVHFRTDANSTHNATFRVELGFNTKSKKN